MRECLDKIIVVLFLVMVAFTALAHGAVEPWSVAIFELLILIMALLWVVKSVVNKKIELKIPLTACPVAAFLFYGVIQSVALTNNEGQISSLSHDVEATRSAVKVLFFLLFAHLIVANFFITRERLQTLVNFLTGFGGVLAVFAIIQYFTWNGKIYWVVPLEFGAGGVIGPFVNHNHFAGYMELLIPLPIAFILTGAIRQFRLLYGFAAVMMTVAGVASLSRGGIISLAAGLLFIGIKGISYAARRKTFLNNMQVVGCHMSQAASYRSIIRNICVIALIIAAIFLGTAWVGLDRVVDRLSKNNVVSADTKAQTFENARGWMWKNSVTMFRLNPLYGVGLGAFETAYPNYSDAYSGYPIIDRTHNDYLQILTDTGLIGGALAIWFILTISFSMRRVLGLLEPFQASLAIGISAAILSLLVHSIFDFNLQIPSTSLLFLLLTAVLTIVPFIKEEQIIKEEQNREALIRKI